MFAHFTVRTYDVSKAFFRKKNRIWRLFRCNQLPSTNRNAWFTPCVRIVKWATIYYKNYEVNQEEYIMRRLGGTVARLLAVRYNYLLCFAEVWGQPNTDRFRILEDMKLNLIQYLKEYRYISYMNLICNLLALCLSCPVWKRMIWHTFTGT